MQIEPSSLFQPAPMRFSSEDFVRSLKKISDVREKTLNQISLEEKSSVPSFSKLSEPLTNVIKEISSFQANFSVAISPFPKKYRDKQFLGAILALSPIGTRIMKEYLYFVTHEAFKSSPSIILSLFKDFESAGREAIQKLHEAEKLFTFEPDQQNSFFDLSDRIRKQYGNIKGSPDSPTFVAEGKGQYAEGDEHYDRREYELASEDYRSIRAWTIILEKQKATLTQDLFDTILKIILKDVHPKALTKRYEREALAQLTSLVNEIAKEKGFRVLTSFRKRFQ